MSILESADSSENVENSVKSYTSHVPSSSISSLQLSDNSRLKRSIPAITNSQSSNFNSKNKNFSSQKVLFTNSNSSNFSNISFLDHDLSWSKFSTNSGLGFHSLDQSKISEARVSNLTSSLNQSLSSKSKIDSGFSDFLTVQIPQFTLSSIQNVTVQDFSTCPGFQQPNSILAHPDQTRLPNSASLESQILIHSGTQNCTTVNKNSNICYVYKNSSNIQPLLVYSSLLFLIYLATFFSKFWSHVWLKYFDSCCFGDDPVDFSNRNYEKLPLNYPATGPNQPGIYPGQNLDPRILATGDRESQYQHGTHSSNMPQWPESTDSDPAHESFHQQNYSAMHAGQHPLLVRTSTSKNNSPVEHQHRNFHPDYQNYH